MKKTINNVRVFDGEKFFSLTNGFIENGYITYTGFNDKVTAERLFKIKL